MKVSKKDIKQRMARFEEVSRKSGAKLTHQRLEIFREVAQTVEHPDVEKVFEGVRRRMPTISMDTVYRTLWWLKSLGLITVLGPSRERVRFDANLSNHHHFVCTRCGLTRDFFSDELDSLTLPDSVLSIGLAKKTQVEVKGICLKCAADGKPGARKNERR
ncbi:MAG: transcriptional repressor [Deltaproteobacteria bacterium]|nr:transcriptional repressor [Deltaproteobacteria bacterium]MCL5277204.1 transcriptional repressor [Deltaproteobacteria bacterium]